MRIFLVCWMLALLLPRSGLGLGQSVKTLVSDLSSSDGRRQYNAFKALERLGPAAAPAIPALIKLLGHSEAVTIPDFYPQGHHLPPRRQFPLYVLAMHTLTKIDVVAIIPLAKYLKDRNDPAGVRAAVVLGWLCKDRRRYCKKWVSLIDRFLDRYLPRILVSNLENIAHTGSKRACQRLLALINARDESVRTDAVLALGRLNYQPAVRPLIRLLLTDGSAFMRRFAARALGQLQNPGAEKPLIQALLKDKAGDVRSNAARALQHCRSQRARAALIRALSDSSHEVRLRAAEVFWTVKAPRAIAPLVRALNGETEGLTRNFILHALWKQRATAAIPHIRALIKDQKRAYSHSTARYALKVLTGKLKPQTFAR